MSPKQKIFRVRRNYNQWVNNQTLEDYALRFTAKSARKWSLFRVSNTALGAISFLALEAIGATITLSYGFESAITSILTVGLIIFLAGIPICYYAAKYGVDIDLLTRGASFGYIGSTATSLIYASFTFIFFALEAAIMAIALQLLFSLPLEIGYIISSLIVIPLVTHGITLISRFQLLTQPVWMVLQIIPFIYIIFQQPQLFNDWAHYPGKDADSSGKLQLAYFGAASAVVFSLIAQIGEQVDFLRFLPEKNARNNAKWWFAMLTAGPGWIIVGILKLLAGSFLAFLAISKGLNLDQASDPTQMYTTAYQFITGDNSYALMIAGVFVIISQLKINVTNAYAGSIAWSNFFSRLTHSHPGRVVWLVFNVVIALLLMEVGIYHTLEKTLGAYAIVAVAWLGSLLADLVINKPLGLSPAGIEFRRAYLYDINPVGIGSMLFSSIIGSLCYLGVFGEEAKALSHFITLASCFVFSPAIALLTKSHFYIARTPENIVAENGTIECCICQNHFETEDIASCPAYGGYICSLCCSLDGRCQDLCKDGLTFHRQVYTYLKKILPVSISHIINERLIKFIALFSMSSVVIAVLLSVSYMNSETSNAMVDKVISDLLVLVFLSFLIVAGVISWLLVLGSESRRVANEESQTQSQLLVNEIEAHKKTDKELQNSKELAEAANDAKSRYLTGISHELRTPLNSILGYAQLLEADRDIPADKRSKVSVIRRNGEHLTDLIEGLLDVSKIEAGKLQICRDQIRMPILLDQLVNIFQLQARQKGILFDYRCDNRLPEFVFSDEKRLRQILINLLSNAIKFTEQGGVSFNVSYKNQVAKLQIVDTGIGIPEDEMERIFRPFERIRRPGMPLIPGTGLGLTITQLLTEIMGGEIKVTNNSTGGVTFTVWLMLSEVVSPAAEPTLKREILGFNGPEKYIMVVDDDPSHRSLIADTLSPLGFHVLEAKSGIACIETFHDFQPDLYLMDISMPDLDGWETSATLRNLGCQKPILILSANAGESSNFESKKQIVSDYLVKPIKIDALLDKLGYWMDIKWAYEATSKLDIAALKPASSNGIPDPEIIAELIFLTEIGHLAEIKRRLSDLENNIHIDQSFLEQLRQCTREVKLNKLREILRNHHEAV
jgi:signal transduction histidine kinase/CheY-like chemotaxis protein